VAAEELRIFSRTANRSGLHDEDVKRWHVFVIAAHREHSRLDAMTLHRWLEQRKAAQDAGWPTDAAHMLAIATNTLGNYSPRMILPPATDHEGTNLMNRETRRHA
jgi:hypothetical protein